jgi:hypothetical protein
MVSLWVHQGPLVLAEGRRKEWTKRIEKDLSGGKWSRTEQILEVKTVLRKSSKETPSPRHL